ncbi:glucuronosyl-N-acetylglucosaminyl-proteoglycan 4-alpha-N-acetylglucosaminyltransferase [Fragilaria crotonensis]|nr:glucuronosyl-N-acetylglucosaminyl-proteoglycan 4-alpha-N-acetylglucosaminyltransferase [Fragilaria crotonensis]
MKRASHLNHQNGGKDSSGGAECQSQEPILRRPVVRNKTYFSTNSVGGRRVKIVWVLVAAATAFLVGVHVFLFQVLVSNQGTLWNEFATPAVSVTVSQQLHRTLTPLRELDYEVYTIRINSWKRLDQLQTSIQHHASCPGAVQIQIVWCMAQGEPPESLLENEKVIVERHEVNSLNERFRIMQEPPTLGILSIDDDVLRPCAAIDAGFFKWTQNPHRMVGFDGRSHTVVSNGNSNTWEYAYLSETERTNRYSMTLPRYAFLHRDYLNWYMTDLPRPIFDRVATNFNCEDIAMSFFVSSLTNGNPPLLADKWASVGTQIKLYSHNGGISDSLDHKALRDACINDFAELLQLKDRLQYGRYIGPGIFSCGAEPQYQYTNARHNDNTHAHRIRSSRQAEFDALRKSWESMSNNQVIKALMDMKSHAMVQAYWNGLIIDSEPWEKRWNLKATTKSEKKNAKKDKKIKKKDRKLTKKRKQRYSDQLYAVIDETEHRETAIQSVANSPTVEIDHAWKHILRQTSRRS